MSKQPYYHRCEGAVLFTCTQPLTEDDFIAVLEKGLKKFGLVKGSVEVECIHDGDGELVSGFTEPEPGDPDDLR